MLDLMQIHGFDYPHLSLETDRVAIQIILRNLLDNAIKYHKPEGSHGASLACSLTVAEHAGGVLEMTFQDNGPGFPQAAMQFLNGGKLRCDSGFGLLAVRRLIDTRGGTLAVSNEADGACLRFTLPGRVLSKDQSATHVA